MERRGVKKMEGGTDRANVEESKLMHPVRRRRGRKEGRI